MSIERRDLDPDAFASQGAPVDQAAGPLARWNSNYPRLARLGWVALGLAMLALLIWAIYPKPQIHRHFMPGPQPVGVATALNAPIDITLNALGTVTPLATATVKPQVSGLLTRLYFKEGQKVKAGDPLAQIDPRPFQAALDQAKGQLARDLANLTNAKADLTRYKPLAGEHAIPIQQLATQEALVRSESGLVEADRAAIEAATINLGYTRIVSPVTGSVGLHLVDVGNMVQAGQATGIVVVTQLSPMSVVFSVPEDNISHIMARFSGGAVLEADAWDRNQSTRIASGKLAAVDNVVDPSTGTVKLRAIFPNTDGKLFPGQFVNIRLLVETLSHQTVVPVSAIQRGPDGNFAFIVNADHTVSERPVELGVQEDEKVAIEKGLEPGDTVVIDGADRLRDGSPVTIPGKSGQHVAQLAGAAREAGHTGPRAGMRAELENACGADFAKFCAGKTGYGGMRCLMENRDSLSQQCKATLESLRRSRRRAAP